MSRKPHVEFTMSFQPIAAALEELEIADPATRQAAGQGQGWVLPESWEPYVGYRSVPLGQEAAAGELAAIEAKLAGLEQDFAAWLAAEPRDADGLRRLTAELAAAETLITGAGSHATFPFFARFFLLEAMVFGKRMEIGDTTGADQLAKVQLWWRSRDYLQQVFQSAYAERVGHFVLRQTGALKDRVFAMDLRDQVPLTIDVAAGGQDEIELRRVCDYLASRAAWRYIQRLGIAEGALVLSHAHATITVTENSRFRQEDLVDPSKFWQEQQESIEAEIERNRAACGMALERLLLPELVPGAAISRPELERAPPGYWGYLEIVIPGVISMIPVVGPAVGVFYGVYLKLLGGLLYPDTPDPLIEFEKKMIALIFDKIAEANARTLNSMLKGYEDELKELLPSFQTTPSLAAKTKAIALYQKIKLDKDHFLTPASESYYKTAPYWARYFICALTAAELAQKAGDDRNFPQLRKVLYEDTNRLVYNAIHGICGERRSRIRIKNTSNGCSSDIKEVYDYRVDKKYSSDLRSYSATVQSYADGACQWAAGMATAIQFIREMAQELNDMIIRDTVVTNSSATGFKPATIPGTFSNEIWYLQGQCWSTYELLRRMNLQHLVYADVGKMNDATAAQRELAEKVFPGNTIFKL